MIITTSDFTLGAFIPNRDDAPNSEIIGNEPILQGFIDTEVDEVLTELLGYALWTELKAQLTDPGNTLPAGADQKWLDLVNGKENYPGMKKFLVPFVFYKFMMNDRADYSTLGVHVATSDSAERVNPSAKAIGEYQKFYKFAIGSAYAGPRLIVNSMGMPGLIWGSYGSQFASMYDFLAENIDTYSNWVANLNIPQHNVYDI